MSIYAARVKGWLLECGEEGVFEFTTSRKHTGGNNNNLPPSLPPSFPPLMTSTTKTGTCKRNIALVFIKARTHYYIMHSLQSDLLFAIVKWSRWDRKEIQSKWQAWGWTRASSLLVLFYNCAVYIRWNLAECMESFRKPFYLSLKADDDI
jgi:hypothetical protein